MKTLLIAICLLLLSAVAAQAEPQPIRFGITPAIARNQYALFEDWRTYLQRRLHRPVEFVLRDSLHESEEMVRRKKLDFAWVSAPSYLENRQKMRLLASPLYHGRPYDRAYLIVSAQDHGSDSMLKLKDRIFAHVDPESNTGYLEPRFQVQQAGYNPDQFFRKTFFTGDHLKVIAAVAIGLADGGEVSGFAWETLSLTRHDITDQTRVISKSADFAFPPIVARRSLDSSDYTKMQLALLAMSADTDGVALLERLNLDGFVTADEKIFRGVERMMQGMSRP